MDPFLLISTIVGLLILLGVNFYLMVTYIHPDDKGIGSHIVLKMMVMLGLTLCWALILMVPLDVSNTRYDGGLDMVTFWEIIFLVIALMTIFLIPFFIFLYETDEEKNWVKVSFSSRESSRPSATNSSR